MSIITDSIASEQIVGVVGVRNGVVNEVLGSLNAGVEIFDTNLSDEAVDILLVSYPLLPDDHSLVFADILSAAKTSGHRMQERGGRIVFILSAMSAIPARRYSDYSTEMAAALASMRGLAMTLAPNVLVNAVGVGTIEASDGSLEGGDRDFLSHASVGRAGTISEVASAVLFFCDPLNTYTNGQILSVDGGWTAGYARNF